MRFLLLLGLLLKTTLSTTLPSQDAASVMQDLQKQAEAKLREIYKSSTLDRPGSNKRTLGNAAIRRDW